MGDWRVGVDGWGGVVLSSISYSVETLLVPVTGFLHTIISRRSRHLWSVSRLFLFFLVSLSFSFSYPFRHLKEMDVVPHPQNICPVHVPSSTQRTWKWSPTPNHICHVSAIFVNIDKIFTNVLSFCPKHIFF